MWVTFVNTPLFKTHKCCGHPPHVNGTKHCFSLWNGCQNFWNCFWRQSNLILFFTPMILNAFSARCYVFCPNIWSKQYQTYISEVDCLFFSLCGRPSPTRPWVNQVDVPKKITNWPPGGPSFFVANPCNKAFRLKWAAPKQWAPPPPKLIGHLGCKKYGAGTNMGRSF